MDNRSRKFLSSPHPVFYLRTFYRWNSDFKLNTLWTSWIKPRSANVCLGILIILWFSNPSPPLPSPPLSPPGSFVAVAWTERRNLWQRVRLHSAARWQFNVFLDIICFSLEQRSVKNDCYFMYPLLRINSIFLRLRSLYTVVTSR